MVYRVLNFIARQRVTFAKFVSDKKGDFWFNVFLNFIATKRVTFTKFVSDKKGNFLFVYFLLL